MADNSSQMLPVDIVDALMKDPVKRGLLLQLIAQEKDGFENYKRRQQKSRVNTPLRKVKRMHCESPTALLRRRALQSNLQDVTSDSSSSEMGDTNTEAHGPKLPFEELLKGVRAYVEIKRNGEDRSAGIKSVMQLMGATIKDSFTNDVTHVVFKDGSFTTYQKAKLLKVHLVSVLWLDAIKRNNARVPEKNFPAFGSKVDDNVSILCSQITKEFEDVIKDERRRSMSLLSKSPKKFDKNRRQTVMTSQTSRSSYATVQNLQLTDDERASTSSSKSKSLVLTSDDSDCGVIDGEASKRSWKSNLLEENSLAMEDSLNDKKISESPSLISCVSSRKPRRTINTLCDMEITPGVSSNKIQKSRNSSSYSSAMSSLRISTDSDRTKSGLASRILSVSDKTRSGLLDSVTRESDRTKSGLANSNLQISQRPNQDASKTTIGTTMSSLRLSEGGENDNGNTSSSKKTSKSSTISTRASTRRSNTITSPRSTRKSSQVSVALFKSPEKTKDKTNKTLYNVDSGYFQKKQLSKQKNLLNKEYGKKSVIESGTESENLTQDITPSKRRKPNPMVLMENVTTTNKSIEKASQHSPSSKENNPDNSSHEALVEVRNSFGDYTIARRLRRSTSTALLKSTTNSNSDSAVKTPCKQRTASVSPTKASKNKPVKNLPLDDLPKPKKIGSGKGKTTPERTEKILRSDTATKKMRKLYNPDDVNMLSGAGEEETEREQYQKQKSKKSPADVFVNPNNVRLTTTAKKKQKSVESETSNCSSDDGEGKEMKRKKSSSMRRDSSADEQTELLNLLTKPVNSLGIRRSGRLSVSQVQPNYTFSSSSNTHSTSSLSQVLPITPIKRRSTLDFMSLTQSQQKRKLRFDPQRRTSIVCTKMHRNEVLKFETIVRDIGTFFIEDIVTNKTSHLVAGESKRTVNMLRALARGCWILKHEWLLKSEDEGKWLPEEDYELTDFSSAVQQCRLQRQAFGPSYTLDVFKSCGLIYVGKNTKPQDSDLKELILTCQGEVTNVYRNAKIVVGTAVGRTDQICVTEQWVLDCITFNKLKPFKGYLVKEDGPSSPIY